MAYPCACPTCPEYVARRGAGCPAHQAEAKAVNRHRLYDERGRDRVAKAFYNSAEWRDARERCLIRQPWCDHCAAAWATTVHHHPIPLAQCTPRQRTDPNNLQPVCASCHSAIERAIAAEAAKIGQA